ncbi:DUF1311 domain-containing protein [Shimwellia pseudoproteus]|uniref:lysozyme inhibitor LprI family protein n=1 Tax=Shimwellia pseudoproteus TaxID=570012 RepID=UPI0018EA9B18|nr:lysozyme inhibitor LprI family protein [Shimwellia pseudoproteus]MBJ3815956.1 DUF1311 domain-containing protein [Shimwellia pseudoproteus]
MKPVTLFALSLLLPGAALAANCDQAATQTEMNTCSAEQYQQADRQLNATWQNVSALADDNQKALLKKAQNAWIALRNADCALLASGTEGGSVQPMIRNQCMTDKTRDREAFLASLTQCDEGDLSCPLRGH